MCLQGAKQHTNTTYYPFYLNVSTWCNTTQQYNTLTVYLNVSTRCNTTQQYNTLTVLSECVYKVQYNTPIHHTKRFI